MTVTTTLPYGKSFHFYHEAQDNNHVYLELEDVDYDASNGRVRVANPINVGGSNTDIRPSEARPRQGFGRRLN